jgi:myo-inositol-1(or 4)-monophosphatase
MHGTFDPRSELELAVGAAREAGDLVLRYFRQDTPVEYKSEDQPVTEADVRADALLRERLIGARPGYGWLSEETKDAPDRLRRDRVWIVDPIDGTNSFILGIPEYVVSIALARHGRVEVGVVYNPSTDELFHAVRGGGAFRNGERIRVSGSVGSLLASRSDLQSGEFDPLRDSWTPTPLGSTAYKMVKVADGTGAAYVSRGAKSEWDVAAADLIVEEAGGIATDAAGYPLRYNRPEPFLEGMIAAAPATHPELTRRVAALPQAGSAANEESI